MKFNYQQLYDHYPQNNIFRSRNKQSKTKSNNKLSTYTHP